MSQFNPYYEGPIGAEPGIRFSRTEVFHLSASVGALTIAFAYFRAEGPSIFDGVSIGESLLTRTEFLADNPLYILASFLAVASGFVFHELAHKVVAQRIGLWAEYRAMFGPLGLSIAIALLLKFVFAAPGAVVIMGRVTPKENGWISIAGPATNIVIALATMPFIFTTNVDAPVPLVFGTVSVTNAVLAWFNLLPFGILDGRKVFRWSKLVWVAAFGGAMALMLFLSSRVLPPG